MPLVNQKGRSLGPEIGAEKQRLILTLSEEGGVEEVAAVDFSVEGIGTLQMSFVCPVKVNPS